MRYFTACLQNLAFLLRKNVIESIIFFLSSAVTLYLLYLKVSSTIFEQVIAASLVLILILTRLFLSKLTPLAKRLIRHTMIFLSALLIQILVLSSGGFHSPFLILLHLFTLGTSFLLNLSGAIIFLIFSLILLILNIFLDPRIMELFRQDIFTVVLYIISFLVIIPLAQLLIRTYHLKTALSNMLSQYLNLGQQREKSMLKGLPELILVTDSTLKILSVSEAVEKNLKLSSQDLVGNILINVLPLNDKQGNKLTIEGLYIESILSDRAARIVKDCYLDVLGSREEIVIQIRPILNQAGKVSQLVFVITDAKQFSQTGHVDLEEALKRHQTLITDLKKVLLATNETKLKFQVDILNHIEEDLLTTLEAEDHTVIGNTSLVDVAEVCQKMVLDKQEFAKSLGVLLKFVLPENEAAEAAKLSLIAANVPKESLGASNFSIPTDSKWFQLIVQKVLELSVFLSFQTQSPKVDVEVESDNRGVTVTVSFSFELKSSETKEDLFTKYYRSFNLRPGLNFSSGLEGFIAKVVAEKLNIPLEINYYNSQKLLKFILKLAR